MAFTKIQPQQVQLATFLSHSGHLTFSDLTTGVEVYINSALTGDFDIDGTLQVDGATVLTSNASNTFADSNKILGGQDNTVTGANNVIIGGSGNANISGDFNVAINSTQFDFGASGQRNIAIGGGASASFDDQITGSILLADKNTAPSVTTNQSLLISFDSGVKFDALNSGVEFDCDAVFDGNSYFNDDFYVTGDNVYFGTHLNVNSQHSGIFSGGMKIQGGPLYVGSAADFSNNVTLQDDSLAASRDWVTGGYDSSEGLIIATSPASSINNGDIGSVRIQVSGYWFDVSGTWRTPS